jgi:hypothetical protein
MVLNAEDLTINAVNPAYKELLETRNVNSLPLAEVFGGKDMEEFIKVLSRAVSSGESINTAPIAVSIGGNNHSESRRFVHTIVPISDATGTNINRLFIYSERVE